MTKDEAINEFGSVRELAETLDISVQAIYQWPDDLSRSLSDRVTLALMKRKMDNERMLSSVE